MKLYLAHFDSLVEHFLWRLNMALLPLKRLGGDREFSQAEAEGQEELPPMSGWKLALISIVVITLSFASFFL